LPQEDLRATLSYDGKDILYRTKNIATGVIHTTLYDGHETYEMDSNSRIADIEPGFDLDRFYCCPIPGVGLPKAPLFADGIPPDHIPLAQLTQFLSPYLRTEHKLVGESLYNSPGQSRDYGLFCYTEPAAHPRGDIISGFASVVAMPKDGQPMVLWYDTFENIKPNLGSLWEYYGHERFAGIWLATRIRMRKYITLTSTRQSVLHAVATYNLVSAVDAPLEKSAYDPATYLSAHANIGDETGPTVRAFVYEPGNGPLQLQRKNAVMAALGTKEDLHPNTGWIGLFVVIVLTSIWFIWRRLGGQIREK
jgi:hypothetical protein